MRALQPLETGIFGLRSPEKARPQPSPPIFRWISMSTGNFEVVPEDKTLIQEAAKHPEKWSFQDLNLVVDYLQTLPDHIRATAIDTIIGAQVAEKSTLEGIFLPDETRRPKKYPGVYITIFHEGKKQILSKIGNSGWAGIVLGHD